MINTPAELKDACSKTLEHFRQEITRMRGARASSALLEGLSVDYYGSTVPLQQLGLINAPEARLLTVQVYDTGAVDAVEKAIQQADLGLNPSREGNLLRIPIPPLTEDRRKDLIKKVHQFAEESRVSIRNHRKHAIDELKKMEKAKEISEDDRRRDQDEIQKIVDQFVKDIDELLAKREEEMLEI